MKVFLVFIFGFILIFFMPFYSMAHDTDGDGYSDEEEIKNNYSPFNSNKVKIYLSDVDKDGLNDWLEIKFKTDPFNPDTDGDNYKDGIEVYTGYDPVKSEGAKLEKMIKIYLKHQDLSYELNGIELGKFKVSTGKRGMSTPKGEFKIGNKSPRVWSKTYKLWMPYWIGISGQRFGIHELPEWPNGYKEGENHLGMPVSHGCIRLGVGPAKTIYNWAEPGVKIKIF